MSTFVMGSLFKKTFILFKNNIGAALLVGGSFFILAVIYSFISFGTGALFDGSTPLADLEARTILSAHFSGCFFDIMLVFASLPLINSILNIAKGEKFPFSKAFPSLRSALNCILSYAVYITLWYTAAVLIFFAAMPLISAKAAGWYYSYIVIAGFILVSGIFLRYLFVPVALLDGFSFKDAFKKSIGFSKENKGMVFLVFVIFPVIFYSSMFVGVYLLVITFPLMVLFMAVSYFEAKTNYIQKQ